MRPFRVPERADKTVPSKGTRENYEMARIICNEDCQNAPRKQQLKDLQIAFARCDTKAILEMLSEDINWNILGHKKLSGLQAVSRHLETLKDSPTSTLTIDQIITHGKSASLNGTTKLKDGAEYGFCDVYEFSGAGKNSVIKNITTYCLRISEDAI